MSETAETVEKFEEISEETQEFFDKVVTKMNMPYSLKYSLVSANKQKQLVKMNKLNEMLTFITGVNAVLSFNEILFDRIDNDVIKEILIIQEMDKLSVDVESGRIRTVRPDMTTFSGIIKKYGWEDVARANQLDELASSQQQEQLTDAFLAPDRIK